jgi:broad specificity phosphatase PhoE
MIYFIRHAQSEANRDRIYAGSSIDVQLTYQGVAQFTSFARANQHIFSKIFVSNLKRSIDSGKIFQDEQNYETQLIEDARLNELDFGHLSGKEYIDFDNTEAYKQYNIESKESFYKRVKEFYDTVSLEASSADIVIIAHAGVGKMLYTIALGLNFENYNDAPEPQSHRIHLISV